MYRSGRDATVSWDGPDFSFTNQYIQPILIRSYAGGGCVSSHSTPPISLNINHESVPTAMLFQRK